MSDDDVTKSLLEEYSIAEVNSENADECENIHVEEIHRESLRDAFSRYAKVIFHDIADSYPTDADVQCFFSLTIDMKHKDGDVVGLFRLGWRSPTEMITSQVVPKPTSEDQRDFQVQFKASDLPKDEGEIYQLCYISENEVWGASVPFEFRRATAEELLVVDSGDLVIVRSQSAVVEDLKCQLATLRNELIAAEANNGKIGKHLTELQEENKLLKKRLEDLEKIEQVLERLRAENQDLEKSCSDSKCALLESELKIDSLNSLIKSLLKDLDILKKQSAMQSQQNLKRESVAMNSEAQRGFSQDLVDALREGKELAVREMRSAMVENDKLQLELANADKEREFYHQKIDKLSQSYSMAIRKQEKNEIDHKQKIEKLLVKFTQLACNSQKRLSEAEAETQVLQKKVLSLETILQNKSEALQHLSSQLTSRCSMRNRAPQERQEAAKPSMELTILQNRLKSLQTLCKEACTEIEKIEDEMTTLQQTEAGLIMSQNMLTSRVKSLQKIITDAERCDNYIEAEFHCSELTNAEKMLQEKSICMESVRQRRDELEKQLQVTVQESADLEQEEAETASAIATLEKNIASRAKRIGTRTEKCHESSEAMANEVDTEQTRIDSCFQRAEAAWNCQMSNEVAELQERLRQAAEAYKSLYQEKLHADRQLLHAQEMMRCYVLAFGQPQ